MKSKGGEGLALPEACCCKMRCCANPQEVWVVQRLIFRAGYRLVVEHLLSTSVAVDSIPSTAEIKKKYIHSYINFRYFVNINSISCDYNILIRD